MIVRVRIGDETIEVSVGDLQARPIVATVEGQAFEVWPEAGQEALAPANVPGAPRPVATVQGASSPAAALPPVTVPAPTAPAAAAGPASNAVLAPLPGTIVALAVAPGAKVAVGQELCALEAMKMRNLIRAPRAGTIRRVAVSVGQTVKHRDLLFELGD